MLLVLDDTLVLLLFTSVSVVYFFVVICLFADTGLGLSGDTSKLCFVCLFVYS